MKAVSYYIVVEDIKKKPAKIAGLELTEKLTKEESRYKKANVISAGDQVVGIVKNDIIYYDAHAGHVISYDDNIYKVIKMQDVVLVK